MKTKQQLRYLTAILFTVILFVLVKTNTDPLEVLALQDFYKSLSNPQQLRGWKLEGGDPCGEDWIGVSCYGSSIVELHMRELKFVGSLGNQLQHLHNLKNLDVSFNNLQDEILFGLPPNATQYLNLSHNSLSGPLENVFSGLQIKEMDLSFNNVTGDLPSSFGSLINLTSLYLQNNRFTRSVIYLFAVRMSHRHAQNLAVSTRTLDNHEAVAQRVTLMHWECYSWSC